MTSAKRYDYLLLIAAAIWGVAFYFQKSAMTYVGPLLFLGLRAGIAAIALLPFAVRETRRPGVHWREVLPIAGVGGLVFFLAGSIQQTGIVTATVINTGLLTALYVVITPFLFWVIERQLPPTVAWLAALLAFLGVWSLGGGSLGAFSTGDYLVALSAIGWSAHMVITGRAGRLGRPITFTLQKLLVVAACSLTLAVILEPISLAAVIDAMDAILYVGLLSTALTFGIVAIALQHVSAPRASVLISTEVLFSTAAGYLLLDERLPPIGWVGALLIVAAVVVVRLRGAS